VPCLPHRWACAATASCRGCRRPPAQIEIEQLTANIEWGTAEIEQLTANIERGTAEKSELDQDIASHTADRTEAEKTIKESTALRAKEAAELAATSGDAKSNIEALGFCCLMSGVRFLMPIPF